MAKIDKPTARHAGGSGRDDGDPVAAEPQHANDAGSRRDIDDAGQAQVAVQAAELGDGAEREGEAPSLIRLPWQVVAGGLVLVLLVALGLGVYANRYLRPQTLAPATVVAAATGLATPAPVVVPTAQPATVAATEVPKPVVISVSTPTPLVVATAEPTNAPSPSAMPTIAPELAAEIDAAYQHYWQVRAEALYDLDTSHLGEVSAGEHLSALEEFVAELRANGRAVLTKVDHDLALLRATATFARIEDVYTDDSVFIDAVTHEPTSNATGEIVKEQYQLEKVDGVWVVTGLARAR
jgi:hypothetical protein